MPTAGGGPNSSQDPARPRSAPAWARWTVAAIYVVYGFAKLNGSQFTVPAYVLDHPLGEVSGFWLTWHYYGYSTVYGTLLALVQIGGGLLLTVRRTWLVGALLLVPVAANILLVGVLYGVDLGGTLAAAAALGLLLYMLSPHARDLWRELTVREEGRPGPGGWRAWTARVALVLGAAGFTWWVANVNNRSPTPLDGVWSPTSGTSTSMRHVETVFFERNRAFMAVVKDTAGGYLRRHFEVEGETVRIWERWLEKGELLYRGTHSARRAGDPDTVTLRAVGRRDGRLVLVRTGGPDRGGGSGNGGDAADAP